MKTNFKNFLISLLFPQLMRNYKNCKERYEHLQKKYWDQKDQLKALKDSDSNKKELFELLNQFILLKDETLLSVQADKNGIYNIIALRESERSDLFEIKAYNTRHGLYSPACMIAPKYIPHTNNIFIDDFTGRENLGLGSIAMEALINYASERGVNSIKGKIAHCDYTDHIDRLKYFYSKHGFQIILDEDNKTGKIARLVQNSKEMGRNSNKRRKLHI